MARIGKTLHTRAAILGSDQVVANLQAIPLGRGGSLGLQCVIETAAGAAPTDNPQGVFELYASGDGITFTMVTDSGAVTELAKIKPNGNARVEGFASFTGIPASSVKVRYNATSGGTGDSRCTLIATYDDE